eukprot:5326831-Pyramimonas_sp.AAC.1
MSSGGAARGCSGACKGQRRKTFRYRYPEVGHVALQEAHSKYSQKDSLGTICVGYSPPVGGHARPDAARHSSPGLSSPLKP